ncbi:MAG TPA: toll/interleukin-1 receptor domain-containing protein [Terricaulis sp.]|nr:toll/interleukin-1 receptor domain-containing protein [Terricaulis sp.]
MTGSQTLRVFISYARSDASAFAEELMAGLEAAGFDPFLDLHDIVPGEDWEARLGHLLHQADTVIYVITPASVASERCAWEVERAAEMAKRVLPVLAIAVDEAQTPERLRRLNYIHFTNKERFGASLKQLTTALRTDIDWIREHTRIAELAARWRERSGDESQLMRGGELAAAKAWLAAWKPGAPEATANQREFVNASEAAEEHRNSAQRQQLDKLIAMQRSRGRLAIATVLLTGTLLIAGVVALYLYQSNLDQRQRYNALLNQQLTEQRQELLAVSRQLENASRSANEATPGPLPGPLQAPAATNQEVERMARDARMALSWRIDVFACEGVAGAETRANRVAALLSEQPDDVLSVPIGRVRVRALTAEVNQRRGYQVNRDEIRAEASETSDAEALRAFIAARRGPQLALRQSGTPTVNYLSIFICAAE